MGCGAGRHAFEMYRRGADVIAFDQDADELAEVRELFVAMREAGEVPEGADADVKEGDALRCPSPTASSTGSSPPRCSSTSPPTSTRSRSWSGSLRPGGTLAISVPRWLPEVVNWKLSDDYHNAAGGHIRIYTDHELVDKVTKAGATTARPATRWSSRARTTPTACTRRTGGSSAPSASTTTTTRW